MIGSTSPSKTSQPELRSRDSSPLRCLRLYERSETMNRESSSSSPLPFRLPRERSQKAAARMINNRRGGDNVPNLPRQKSLLRKLVERVPSVKRLNSDSTRSESNSTIPADKELSLLRKIGQVKFQRKAKARRCTIEFTKEDYENYWYSREELRTFMATETAHVLRLMADSLPLPESTTFRGLETCTDHGDLEQKSNRLNALMSVVNEQSRQRVMGEESDAEAMRRVYMSCTEHCKLHALRTARKDAREADY